MSEHKKSDHGHKRKPHEKRIVSRPHFNNLDMSHFAEHDWQKELEEHLKLVAKAEAKKAESATEPTPPARMIVRSFFETIDRVGDEEGELLPANDPVFDDDPPVVEPIAIRPNPDPNHPGEYLNYVDIEVDAPEEFSGKELVDALGESEATSEYFSDITYKDKNTIPPPWYVENITINDDPYTTTPDEVGYTPDTPLPEEVTFWLGFAWMFSNPPLNWLVNNPTRTRLPNWEPDDNDPWDEAHPDGEDDYPNGTLDMYGPLYKYLSHHTELINGEYWEVYEILFSFEKQSFDFVYEPQIIDGVTKWVLVIRPMRRKKKK
jgi:hypothetical protein